MSTTLYPDQRRVTLFVRFNGRIQTVQVNPNCEIQEIKDAVLPKMRLSKAASRSMDFDLCFNGKYLESARTMSDYNVHRESTLEVRPRAPVWTGTMETLLEGGQNGATALMRLASVGQIHQIGRLFQETVNARALCKGAVSASTLDKATNLEHASNIRTQDTQGSTAFHVAANGETVKLLAQWASHEQYAGLRCFLAANTAKGFIHPHIIRSCLGPMVALRGLNDIPLLNEARPNGTTPLMQAAANGNLSVVTELLNLGAATQLRDESFHSAYDLASAAGHIECALRLHERRCSPRCPCFGDPCCSLWDCAAKVERPQDFSWAHSSCIQWMLRAKASLEDTWKPGPRPMTALDRAAQDGNVGSALALLQAKANLLGAMGARGGSTALHYAATVPGERGVAIVRLLCAAKANVTRPRGMWDSHTPVDVALESNNTMVLDELLQQVK